jgi:hypothetical protein
MGGVAARPDAETVAGALHQLSGGTSTAAPVEKLKGRWGLERSRVNGSELAAGAQ